MNNNNAEFVDIWKNEWLSYTADEKLDDVYVNITKTTNFNHYYLTESGNQMGNTQK